MKNKIPMIARYLLGLIFFASGLVVLLNLAPPPANLPENVMKFMAGVSAAPYFFPLLKVTETICGALLLAGFFVPVALVILAPITIQIFFYHAFMTPGLENMIIPVVVLVLHITAATAYWHLYRPLFRRG